MTTFADALQRDIDARCRSGAALLALDQALDAASTEAAEVVGAAAELRFVASGRSVFAAAHGVREELATLVLGADGSIELRWSDHRADVSEDGAGAAVVALLESRATGDRIASLLSRAARG